MANKTQQEPVQTPTGMTYAQIGAQMGLTASAVRKIEQKALAKLRKGLERKGYDIQDVLQLTEQRTTQGEV